MIQAGLNLRRNKKKQGLDLPVCCENGHINSILFAQVVIQQSIEGFGEFGLYVVVTRGQGGA